MEGMERGNGRGREGERKGKVRDAPKYFTSTALPGHLS